jgi:hypothetical protein
MKNRIVTGENPEIVIEMIEGDAAVRGWPHPEIYVAIDPQKMEIVQQDNRVTMRLRGDAAIQAPAGSSLTIARTEGDLAVNGMAGSLTLGRVHGDAAVRNSGPLTIGQIEGDLNVRGVQGDCTIERVRGDAEAHGVKGTLRIETGDDLSINGSEGSIYAVAADNASLRLNPLPGNRYEVRAGKNLDVRFPANTSAQVEATAGEEIRTRGLEISGIEGKSASFQLGAGEAHVQLVAGKRIDLRGAEAWINEDFSFDIGPEVGARMAEFAQQMEEQVNAVARQVEEKINAMGGSEEVANRIQERILAAARRAEEKINSIMSNAEARGFEGRWHEGRGPEPQWRGPEGNRRGPNRGGRSWSPPVPPVPPAPPAANVVSEEERKFVLRMVGDGSVSVEQAERLFVALNGKPGAVSVGERMLVLQMVGDGSVSVEQAEQLLAALSGKSNAAK